MHFYILSTKSWWRRVMETVSALLSRCGGNPPVIGGFPHKGPVMQSFDIFFTFYQDKLLNKQSRCRFWEALTDVMIMWAPSFFSIFFGLQCVNLYCFLFQLYPVWETSVMTDGALRRHVANYGIPLNNSLCLPPQYLINTSTPEPIWRQKHM